MTPPRITVLMAARGATPYLEETVNSILTQTLADFEFIIIDNNLEPQRRNYLESIGDPRIRIIHNATDLGLTHALNQGLAIAQGTYVARIDDDDIALPERFATQATYLDTHPTITAVGSAIELMDKHGVPRGIKAFQSEPELLRFQLLTLSQMAHPATMFRTDAVTSNGNYDEAYPYAQDYELWSRLSARGHRFSNLPQPLLRYRLHDQSTTRSDATRDKAYQLARTITGQNICRYFAVSDRDFDIFCDAFYRDKISDIHSLTSVLGTWARIGNTYRAKEKLPPDTDAHIRRHIAKQRRRFIFRYIRHLFAPIYATASRLKKAAQKKI